MRLVVFLALMVIILAFCDYVGHNCAEEQCKSSVG